MVMVTCVWPRESSEERKRLLLENSNRDSGRDRDRKAGRYAHRLGNGFR